MRLFLNHLDSRAGAYFWTLSARGLPLSPVTLSLLTTSRAPGDLSLQD